MLRSIAIIQKKDRFGRVQAQQARKIEIHGKEKRIASFLKEEKKSTKLEIPLLSHTFRSTGFINPRAIWSKAEEMLTEVDEAFGSLSIDMVEVGGQEAGNTGLPPFSQGQTLDNWTIVELPIVFKLLNE